LNFPGFWGHCSKHRRTHRDTYVQVLVGLDYQNNSAT
jgi:hypothetical protein